MQDDQPLKPADILNIVATNQGKRPLTPHIPKAKPLSPAQVKQRIAEGHLIVDTRETAVFGAGHIPGAFNAQLSSSEFEQRVGWVTPDDAQIILVTEQDADAQKAIYNMGFIALDSNVSGYLEGGLTAWMDAGHSVQTVGQMDVHTLKHRLNENELQVLDVRDREEWDEGHIEGAHFMKFTSMAQQLDIPPQIGKLPFTKKQHIAVTCATGKRSGTAISMMLREGYKHLYNVTGGMEAWGNAGFNMIDQEGCVICKVPAATD